MRLYLFCYSLGFLLFSFHPSAGQEQFPKEIRNWVLNELLERTSDTTEITCFVYTCNTELFWPDDLKTPNAIADSYADHIIHNEHGLFLLINGTGRVYQVSRVNQQIEINRIDSTVYFGNSFGARTFSVNDTLFSLGGYGYWRFNGHLRYFKPENHGWEILPLNTEIPVNDHLDRPGCWVDYANRQLYYIHRAIHDEWRKNSIPASATGIISDTARVFVLNLDTRNWSTAGQISKTQTEIVNRANQIASLPWGELVFYGTLSSPQILLLDYPGNQVLLLDKTKASRILNILINDRSQEKRSYSWYDGTMFHIISTDKERFSIPLALTDFTLTKEPLYVPVPEEPVWRKIHPVSAGLFITGVLLLIFAGSMLLINKRKFSAAPLTRQALFDLTELELINTIHAKPDQSLLTEELNYILGTTRKSVEVQKKHRSDIIKSINEKYTALTGDTEKLITQERLDEDRRLMRYRMAPAKYDKLMLNRRNGKS